MDLLVISISFAAQMILMIPGQSMPIVTKFNVIAANAVKLERYEVIFALA